MIIQLEKGYLIYGGKRYPWWSFFGQSDLSEAVTRVELGYSVNLLNDEALIALEWPLSLRPVSRYNLFQRLVRVCVAWVWGVPLEDSRRNKLSYEEYLYWFDDEKGLFWKRLRYLKSLCSKD